MPNLEFIPILIRLFPSGEVSVSNNLLFMKVPSKELYTTAKQLKESAECKYDCLECLTAVDMRSHFELVYFLHATTNLNSLVLKTLLERNANPEIESVYSIWKAAELYECEVFDLFGIKFINHPSLRRIFLGDDWPGYPLRKDYNDPVNGVTRNK
jgi:NADH-quinone oxidoreductase subunit C